MPGTTQSIRVDVSKPVEKRSNPVRKEPTRGACTSQPEAAGTPPSGKIPTRSSCFVRLAESVTAWLLLTCAPDRLVTCGSPYISEYTAKSPSRNPGAVKTAARVYTGVLMTKCSDIPTSIYREEFQLDRLKKSFHSAFISTWQDDQAEDSFVAKSTIKVKDADEATTDLATLGEDEHPQPQHRNPLVSRHPHSHRGAHRGLIRGLSGRIRRSSWKGNRIKFAIVYYWTQFAASPRVPDPQIPPSIYVSVRVALSSSPIPSLAPQSQSSDTGTVKGLTASQFRTVFDYMASNNVLRDLVERLHVPPKDTTPASMEDHEAAVAAHYVLHHRVTPHDEEDAEYTYLMQANMPETLDPSSYIETLRWWRENYSDALMIHNTRGYLRTHEVDRMLQEQEGQQSTTTAYTTHTLQSVRPTQP
ncbi:unnamed protein product [Heligmosomoides polygyrus]|uniref:LisH domain-containing protein n=1 Tax=Heligmosomoides polygyrus TaxID=6339 RepID=A0A183FXN2_HELPZ|nr:unnamed protein product [Heligmosomoides polygyrus]